MTVGSSVGPSTPWFHDPSPLLPSRLPSPLPSLCLWSYAVRSARVNPSCAVTKFTDAVGPRSRSPNRSRDPVEPGGEVVKPVRLVAVLERSDVSHPEPARRVPEAVVPLEEGRRELAGAPAVHPEVPGLGDELHGGEDGIRAQRHEERVVRVELVGSPSAERDGEVEAESVHVHLLHPVAQ